jgi:hypothetical protein
MGVPTADVGYTSAPARRGDHEVQKGYVVKKIDVVHKARVNSVAIVSLLLHSMYIMQPLYVRIMKPLTTYYAQYIETWLGSNPGRIASFSGLLIEKQQH